MDGTGIEDARYVELDDEWGVWLEATFDPDLPRYDTLNEQDGHA